MTDRLIDFLAGLTGRERVLLALLCGVVVPLAVWFALLVPMGERRDTARTELADALILRGWMEQSVREKQRLSDVTEGIETKPLAVSELEQSLIAAGLRQDVSELSRGSDQDIDLRFDDVSFQDLGAWITGIATNWGYEIQLFRIERGDKDGRVFASFRLVPAG